MDWIERLNRGVGRVPLASDCVIETRSWAYSPHLADNVPHRHTYFEVCLVGQYGRGEYRVESRSHPLSPGTLFIARPGVLHQIVNTTAPLMELYWVCFTWRGAIPSSGEMYALFRDFSDAAEVLAVPDTGGRVLSLWQTLRTLTTESSESDQERGAALQITALQSALFVAIAQCGSFLPETNGRLFASSNPVTRLALRFVHDNLHRPLSVAEVARVVGISERQVTRLFRDFCGTSPAAYITQARMDRAASLLLRTDDPIKQVASLLGYTDVAHFSRVFSQMFGTPPAQFRKNGGPKIARIAGPDNIGGLV